MRALLRLGVPGREAAAPATQRRRSPPPDNRPMHVFRGLHHARLAQGGPSAVTVGNFDGVHRGHQAMLALLCSEAQHRGLASTVLTFEPHPRDFFAVRAGTPERAPTRIATLRDKLEELERCGIQRAVVLRFDGRLAAQSPQAFIEEVLVKGLDTRSPCTSYEFMRATSKPATSPAASSIV